jgi:DNA-directed RNA polymerase sigma subunit (sigma70/sigma32)
MVARSHTKGEYTPVVMMHENRIYTVDEIAKNLKISRKYVYQILDRALLKIRKNKKLCELLSEYAESNCCGNF